MSKTLFVDIETIPGSPWYQEELAAKVAPPSNYKSNEAISKWWAETGDEQKAKIGESTALMPLYGQIACIGYAFDDEPVEVITCGSEKELLQRFATVISDAASPTSILTWCGHNICAFDIPFLNLRSLVHGVTIPWLPGRNSKPWSAQVFDTMYELAGSDYKGFSLKHVCKALGIPNMFYDKDGGSIAHLWQTPEGKELVMDWCANDVSMTRQIYRRMT
jgi:DNA polymerase elongation subunit (family B)